MEINAFKFVNNISDRSIKDTHLIHFTVQIAAWR
jgi:hypothetical protein